MNDKKNEWKKKLSRYNKGSNARYASPISFITSSVNNQLFTVLAKKYGQHLVEVSLTKSVQHRAVGDIRIDRSCFGQSGFLEYSIAVSTILQLSAVIWVCEGNTDYVYLVEIRWSCHILLAKAVKRRSERGVPSFVTTNALCKTPGNTIRIRHRTCCRRK